jgi:hypothetical protein
MTDWMPGSVTYWDIKTIKTTVKNSFKYEFIQVYQTIAAGLNKL